MSRTDAKTVAILALGCFHPVTKVQSASIHFFLGSEDDNDEESEEEEEVFGSASINLLVLILGLSRWTSRLFNIGARSIRRQEVGIRRWQRSRGQQRRFNLITVYRKISI